MSSALQASNGDVDTIRNEAHDHDSAGPIQGDGAVAYALQIEKHDRNEHEERHFQPEVSGFRAPTEEVSKTSLVSQVDSTENCEDRQQRNQYCAKFAQYFRIDLYVERADR